MPCVTLAILGFECSASKSLAIPLDVSASKAIKALSSAFDMSRPPLDCQLDQLPQQRAVDIHMSGRIIITNHASGRKFCCVHLGNPLADWKDRASVRLRPRVGRRVSNRVVLTGPRLPVTGIWSAAPVNITI